MVSQWTVSQIDGTSLYTIQDSADEEQFASLQGFGVSISEFASFYVYLMIVFFQTQPYLVTGVFPFEWDIAEVAPKAFTVCDI